MHFIYMTPPEELLSWAASRCDCTEKPEIVVEADPSITSLSAEERVIRWRHYAAISGDGSSRAIVIGPLRPEIRAVLHREHVRAESSDAPGAHVWIETWEMAGGSLIQTGEYECTEILLPR